MPSTVVVMRRDSRLAIQIAMRMTATTISRVDRASPLAVSFRLSSMLATRLSRSFWLKASVTWIISLMRRPDSVAARWNSSMLAPIVT